MEDSIKQIISIIKNSKEPGLIIAKDDAELLDFLRIMNEQGFKQSRNIDDLLKTSETYFIIKEDLDKDVYDFIVQYPTGQIQVFNKELMKSEIISPDYENSALILAITKDTLENISSKGFDILSITGPAYQS